MVKVLFVSPLQVQLHCGALTTRPQTKSHRRPVTGCNQQTGEPAGENENSANDESPPLISKNWREFRAGLVAGSAQRHLQAKESAYRTGHWAHSVSQFYHSVVPEYDTSIVPCLPSRTCRDSNC